jgi:hypothetical protein
MTNPVFTTHVVKSWCYLYTAAIGGYKTHDIRDMTERDYKVGDRMKFREFDQAAGCYTGREAMFEITYITDRMTPCAMSSCALEKKYGILSIRLIEVLPNV